MSDERYVVATVVSTHRMRYAIPVSKMETEDGVLLSMTEASVIEYVNDSVTCEEVKEFSQHFLGEQIIDTMVLDEERILKLFDKDNEYLSEWTKEQKLEFIDKWQDNWKKGV